MCVCEFYFVILMLIKSVFHVLLTLLVILLSENGPKILFYVCVCLLFIYYDVKCFCRKDLSKIGRSEILNGALNVFV